MNKKARLEFPFGQVMPPWDIVIELSSIIDTDKWILVGGLMVQAHAMIAELQSRATVDVDLMIDVLADTDNITYVVDKLKNRDFQLVESGLPGAPIHRLLRKDQSIDILIAEHLPSRKHAAAKIGRFPLMETVGGAQAIDRKTEIELIAPEGVFTFFMPDVLGALVLKSAAYGADNRNKGRHLDDVALLSSLVTDVSKELSRLHGSDKRRIRSALRALGDLNHSAWLNLPEANRARGQDVLRILSS